MIVVPSLVERVMDVPFLGVDSLTWSDGRRAKMNERRLSL